MWRAFGGATLIVAGIAAFIEAHANIPVAGVPGYTIGAGLDALQRQQVAHAGEQVASIPARGLSPTAYDLLRIGAWALLVFGAVLLTMGLISYWSTQRGRESPR